MQDAHIRVLDLRTRTVRRISARTTGKVLDVTWTPDGTRLAYLHNSRKRTGARTPPTSVYTIRPDSTGKRRRFTLPKDERRGIWAEALSWR